jgi:glutamine amidotransferase
MMAHIRYATQGSATLENVHPFHRELWGVNWCFAHNGSVPEFSTFSKNKPDEHPLLGLTKCEEMSYHAVGDTDSEAVFCTILNV